MFVDHFSGFTFVYLQRFTTMDETLAAKLAYEQVAASHGIKVEYYRADNGRFAEARFRSAITESNQKFTYCAVGGHHQNGIVERKIRDLTLAARTMLLHAKRCWPDVITPSLWPFALKAAAHRYNHLHFDSTKRNPISKFTGVQSNLHLRDIHTWGCPVYVLDSRLQIGIHGIPKWLPRSHLGFFLEYSPFHAGSVALVMNPTTGLVSPQFHVVFNDHFTTVSALHKCSVPSNWSTLVETSTDSAPTDASVVSYLDFLMPSVSAPESSSDGLSPAGSTSDGTSPTDLDVSSSPEVHVDAPIPVDFESAPLELPSTLNEGDAFPTDLLANEGVSDSLQICFSYCVFWFSFTRSRGRFGFTSFYSYSCTKSTNSGIQRYDSLEDAWFGDFCFQYWSSYFRAFIP